MKTNFITALEKVSNSYLSEISAIADFVDSTDSHLVSTGKKPKGIKLTKKDRMELKGFSAWLSKMIDGNLSGSHQYKVGKKAGDALIAFTSTVKRRTFMFEMALSYLISHQEAFIKDFMIIVFCNRRNMLKSDSQQTYAEILKHSSMKQIIENLAQKEVERIGYFNIDQVRDYLLDKMNIDIAECSSWATVREASYRRNICIHNKMRTNEVYCKKTGYPKIGEHLGIDGSYVRSVADSIIKLVDFVHESVRIKMRLKARSGLRIISMKSLVKN